MTDMSDQRGFVLSAEGGPLINKNMWTTHIVEGIFDTFKEASEYCHNIGGELWDDEMIWIITDLSVRCRGGGKGVHRWVPVDGQKEGGWKDDGDR